MNEWMNDFIILLCIIGYNQRYKRKVSTKDLSVQPIKK